ncbi:ketopantoate reductase family protein [Clostridium pasteurianum]|uniref:2-dehydropantoate 2-reductase n=1 Tax=Clostridium pasteurianum BC1 TaxID=86416 RepID=R4K722_CLOPA|nr:2-dehydropantoate 2-reductase [Clostridium pasteurianum]AGK98363.1 2-dehydropantoate 2-reductase [Clostridium pasteurianum BC1]
MGKIKNISLIGLGAIGCAYGSKLYDMNPEAVKVIAGGERAKKYRENGFFINGKKYDFQYVTPEEKCEPADLIIVAVKSNQLHKAIEDITNHVGENTIILSLLNGITSEEIIGSTFGMDKILYSLCVAIDANRDKNNINFSSYGNITFGEKSNTNYSQRVMAVKELFEKASIPYVIPEDMMHALWWKFMINVGINQCSAVLKAKYGVFQTNIEARNLMDSTMMEVVKLSEKTGVNLNKDDIKKWYEVLYNMNPNSRTSMLQDIESGRKTEVDIFAGTVCELGNKYKLDTPVNRTLYNIIKVIENKEN